MKRLFSVLLLAFTLLTALSGCLQGNQTDGITPNATTPNVTTPESTIPEETTPEGIAAETTTEDVTTPETPPEVTPPKVINDLTMGTYYLPYSLRSEPISLTFYENGRFEAKYPDDAEGPYCNSYRVKDGQVILAIENPEKSHVFTILENALVFDHKASTANLWDSLALTREVIYFLPDVSESDILATTVMAENDWAVLPEIGKIYGKYQHTVGSNTYDV